LSNKTCKWLATFLKTVVWQCVAVGWRLYKRPFINYVRCPEGGGVGKISTYRYFEEGGPNSFVCNIFILEITRSSGLAEIIFHLLLEGKKVLG